MIEAGIAFPKTHDLVRLLDLLSDTEPSWEMWRPDLDILTDYAVSFRYPEESATVEEAKRAFKICKALRAQIRESLRLRDPRPQRPKRRRKV